MCSLSVDLKRMFVVLKTGPLDMGKETEELRKRPG